MAKMIKVEKVSGKVEMVNVEGLGDMYRYIECDCIDIAVRSIEGRTFDIIVDDEGLLKDNAVVMAIDETGHDILVGNLLLCHDDEEGNETDATEDDLRVIKNHMENGSMVFDRFGFRPVLTLD